MLGAGCLVAEVASKNTLLNEAAYDGRTEH